MSVLFTRRGTPPAGGSSGGGGVSGTLASDLAVGTSVFLSVDGVNTEFLIVHQGNPSTSMYDSSCDGTWLLMKDCYESRQWHNSYNNAYGNSTIHSYLNSTFLELFDDNVKSHIKSVKIPYVWKENNSVGLKSGADGLSTQIFLLSVYEVGWTTSTSPYIGYADGSCLSYFSGTAETDSKRIAYLNGRATRWHLRSPSTDQIYYVWRVLDDGFHNFNNSTDSCGIRPALILPSDALFDPTTMEFVGVGGGNSSGGTPSQPATYTVNITGSIHGLHSYVTINGTKYESSGSYTFTEKPTISVYVTGTSTTARNDCSITLNNKLVQDGYGTYTVDFGSAKTININFASGAGALGGTYYSANITTIT